MQGLLPFDDPIFVLRHLGCERLYDYRCMDYNLVRNLAHPELELGASIIDGGFEGVYVGGVAPGWNWVGTGTPSEVTGEDIPWETEGVSAQKIENDTSYGGFILSRSMTGSYVQKQTYQLKFKIKVISGAVRVRTTCYNLPFEVATMRDFQAGDEGEFVVYGGAGRNPVTAISQQIYNIGSTPLTFIIDDLTVCPLGNDTHVFIDAQGFDPGAWDGRGYMYNGGAWAHAKNWNKDGQMNPGNEHTVFSLITPESNCYTMQSYWNAADSKKSWNYKLWKATNDIYGNVSSNGSAHSIFGSSGIDPYSLGRICVLNEYDGPGGTEKIMISNVESAVSYISGAHVNPLYEAAGVPYTHSAFMSSSGTWIEKGMGKFEVLGFFNKKLTDSEKALVSNILLYNR